MELILTEIIKKYGNNFEKIIEIDFSNNNYENLEILSCIKNLEIIKLNNNKINSLNFLKENIYLKEMYLKNNNISNLEELNYLKNLSNLKILDITNNPVLKDENFNNFICQNFPNLIIFQNDEKKNFDFNPFNEIIEGKNMQFKKKENNKWFKNEKFDITDKEKITRDNINDLNYLEIIKILLNKTNTKEYENIKNFVLEELKNK